MRHSVLAIALALSSPTQAAAEQLLIFGGTGHDVFLGCVGCSQHDSGSICNRFGRGSRFAGDSIFNRFGEFGSRFSASSPWNKYSEDASVPVLVDRAGNFYGYFTINKYRADAFDKASDFARMYEAVDGDLQAIQAVICGDD